MDRGAGQGGRVRSANPLGGYALLGSGRATASTLPPGGIPVPGESLPPWNAWFGVLFNTKRAWREEMPSSQDQIPGQGA